MTVNGGYNGFFYKYKCQKSIPKERDLQRECKKVRSGTSEHIEWTVELGRQVVLPDRQFFDSTVHFISSNTFSVLLSFNALWSSIPLISLSRKCMIYTEHVRNKMNGVFQTNI